MCNLKLKFNCFEKSQLYPRTGVLGGFFLLSYVMHINIIFMYISLFNLYNVITGRPAVAQW